MSSTRTTKAPAKREPAPTAQQMQTLSRLAASRGQSFAYPKTRREASAQIKRLIAATPSSRYERSRERAVAKELPMAITDAAAVRDDEVTGYGSSARWAGPDAATDEAPRSSFSHFDPKNRRARIAKANRESNRHLGRGGRR